MTTKTVLFCLLATGLLAGCQGNGNVVSNVKLDTTANTAALLPDNQSVDTLGLQTRDFEFAAQRAVKAFLDSPYARRPGVASPWIAQVGMVVNDTPLAIDTASVTSRIEIGLMKSGLFMITSATGSRSSTFVPDSRKPANPELFAPGTLAKPGTVTAPELSIEGVIRQRAVASGRRQQVEYEFDFKVVEAASGLNLFRDLVDIQKVGGNDSFAW